MHPRHILGDLPSGYFQLHMINGIEMEMCYDLEWELNVDPVTMS